jgi:hypothetical protein
MNASVPTTEPTPPATSDAAITWLPGESFFTERIALPATVSAKELDEFVLTQLELLSPMPSDQLNWGYCVSDSQDHLLLFAKSKELEDETISESGSGRIWLPSFVPFVRYPVEQPSLVPVVSSGTLSLLAFDQAGMLPFEVHSIPLPDSSLNDQALQWMIADLLRDLPWVDLPLVDGIVRLAGTTRDWRDRLTFRCKRGDTGVLEQCWTSRSLLRADVRDSETKVAYRKQSESARVLWFVSLGSVAAMICLTLLSAAAWGLHHRAQGMASKVELQQDRVSMIESKARNLEVFQSGSAARLQPLSMLEILNQHRPDGLYFNQVKAFEGNRIQVEGMAEGNGTEWVNQFRSNLERLSQLGVMNLEITRISQGVTYFRLSAEFKELPVANVGAHT